MNKDVVGQPNHPEVCDSIFGNRSAKRSLGCPDYRTTDKKPYFIFVVYLDESKSEVNSPPLARTRVAVRLVFDEKLT